MARNYTEVEVQQIAKNLIGKTFGEIDKHTNSKNSSNKGSLGQIIENDAFGYEANSFSEPDFKEAGIELKVTPYKINKNKTLSAKERLSLNIINYMEEYKKDFFDSHFWYKNKKIQIIWYLFEKNKEKKDLKITHEKLFEFPEEDLPTIIDDYDLIIQKIKDGKAHEISEADTMYLGASPKGKNKSSLREQPFSDIKAMQRGFCLKTSYMNQLVRKYIGNIEDVERVLKNTKQTFEEFVDNVIDEYKDKTQQELMEIFKLDTDAKNLNSMLISRMFGVRSKLKNTDEFLKANIIPRTVRVEKNGRIKESMPFPAFKYTDIINQEWEESELKETLETTKYMFFVFKKKNKDYVFKGIKLWNMPEAILEDKVKQMWEQTKEIIKTGNIVKTINKKGNRITNFPGMKDNNICHVRPHARNKLDTYPLPVKDKLTGATTYTKHCFWINAKYLEGILEEFI